MDGSPQNFGQRPTAAAPLPPSTINNEATISQFQRLTLSTASGTALPPSPQVASPQKALEQQNHPSSPNTKTTPRSPLRRSPSSTSLDARSSSPITLHRKASMNSIHGVGRITPPRSSSSRRASVQVTNGRPASAMGKSPLSGIEDPSSVPLAPTAASIASAHFKNELEMHEQDVEARPADTIVILHDSCYGHRYSRPRTSRVGLSTIVERPERIHASVLGVSVAYVRLGQRHADGRHPLHPKKDATDFPNIPFRIQKTTRKLALSSAAVTNVHGTKWMEELKVMCDSAETKLAMSGKELTRPDMTRSPDQEPPPKLHEGDLYLCSESLNAMEGALGAVCEGIDAVFQGSADGMGPKRAFVAIRPPGHHCSASYPSGFCWLNNVHVGIAHAALSHGLTHAAIIDFDLHHGDGSQSITWEHNVRSLSLPKNAPSWKKTSIGYFSLHDINSYPCEMGDEEKIKNASLCIENAHGQSIWNVHLQPWKSEHEFWDLYELRYSVLLEKTRAYLRSQSQRLRSLPNQPQPKAAIFLSAGFDASEWESPGMQRHKVNVPTEFYARLTRDVVKLAAEEGCAVEGRIISVLEGGYSDRALSSGVLSHLSGLAGGDAIQVKREVEQNGLGYEMAQKVGAFRVRARDLNASTAERILPYDPLWWALPQLEQLDAIINPPSPPADPKKVKDASPPTYSSPTQSFIGKIVTTPKIRRTSSNLSSVNSGSPRPVSRPPSPPPPEINWATAAHELSKLLIPSDRQTRSCKPEDLSAEASRARRDRQSIIATAPPTGPTPNAIPAVRMSLRERKAAKPLTTAKEEEETEKPISRANRRKTVGGDAILSTEKVMSRSTTPKPEPSYKQPTKQSTRRLSLASSTGSIATTTAPQLSNAPTRTPSVGTTAVLPRPGISQSIRPGSSMSMKAQSNPGVVVKKSRTINPARSDATKNPRAGRKPPTAGPGDGTQELPSLPRAPSEQIPNSSTASTAPHKAATFDIDSITTGMKKVTINLTTKAQREAREQAKLAIKPVSASAPKKTATSAQENTAVQTSVRPPNSGQSPEDSRMPSSLLDHPGAYNMSPALGVSTPHSLSPSRFAHLQDASYVPIPASSSQVSTGTGSNFPSSNSTPQSLNSSVSDVFVPYQPEGPPPAPIPQQESLKWLPPNTSTPAALRRGDLPIFTSTSAIPFGANASKENSGPAGTAPSISGVKSATPIPQKLEPSIWDVPETPGR